MYQFKRAAYAGFIFRSPKLNYDYKNHEQHKQILKEKFANNSSWKIPEILDALLHSDTVYFDEVCQIHMPAWTKGRVALVGRCRARNEFLHRYGHKSGIARRNTFSQRTSRQ